MTEPGAVDQWQELYPGGLLKSIILLYGRVCTVT